MPDTAQKTPLFRLALLASGNGTNAERIGIYFRHHPLIEVSLILYNRERAFVAERAQNMGIEAVYFPDHRLHSDQTLLDILKQKNITHLVLAGFLSLLPPYLIAAYSQRIINIHPALLPHYGGKGMYGDHVHQAVVAQKEKESGMTIHLVDEKYDHGKILFQARCPLSSHDSPKDVAKKVHSLEYLHYPIVIEKWVQSEPILF